MTTIIRGTGIDAAANSVGFAPPVSTGLVGWFHVGVTSAASIRNRAASGAAAVVAGAPTFSALGFASFASASERLDTTLADTAQISLLCVARSAAAFNSTSTQPTIIGTYASEAGGIAGAALQVTGTPSAAPAATVAFTASRTNAGVPIQTPASLTVTNFSNWTFLAGVALAGATTDGRKIYDKTNGTSAVATPASARLANVGTTIRLGNMTSLLQGACDLAWGAIYTSALTEAEIDLIYAFVKNRLFKKYSITI